MITAQIDSLAFALSWSDSEIILSDESPLRVDCGITISKIETSEPYDSSSIHWYYLGSALSMYSSWQLFSFIGYQLGTQISAPQAWGLDIAMVVAIIGIVVPFLKTSPMWICAISAFVLSIISKDWPYQSGLIFSMLFAIATAMLAARFRRESNA